MISSFLLAGVLLLGCILLLMVLDASRDTYREEGQRRVAWYLSITLFPVAFCAFCMAMLGGIGAFIETLQVMPWP